jgi:hypothetical protein
MQPIKHFENKFSGDTCVVIGNGPSLKDIDLPRLSIKYPTFGSNRIYLYPFVPKFYAIADPVMVASCLLDIQKPNFVPDAMFLSRSVPLKGAYLINYAVKWGFSKNPQHELVIGGTVTYVLLQLAYWMGFKKVLLVGVDHSYPGAASHGVPGTPFIQEGDDKDHFSPDYFKPGMVYNRPELEATEKYYRLAKSVFEADGRKIINLSTKTNLLVYDRDNVKNYY